MIHAPGKTLLVTPEIQIPHSEIEFSFARSSGPGGQNVNKVNSKAVLRWNAFKSSALSESVRLRFLSRFGGRLTVDGDLVLASDRYRDQTRNREDCLDKLRALLFEVAYPPKPRKKTRPSRSSIQKNQQKKRLHSQKKSRRGRVFHSED